MLSLLTRKKLCAGALSAIIGIILLIVGMSKNGSASAQLSSVLSGGGTNPGTPFLIIGAILLILGIVLIVLDVIQHKKEQQ